MIFGSVLNVSITDFGQSVCGLAASSSESFVEKKSVCRYLLYLWSILVSITSPSFKYSHHPTVAGSRVLANCTLAVLVSSANLLSSWLILVACFLKPTRLICRRRPGHYYGLLSDPTSCWQNTWIMFCTNNFEHVTLWG